MPIVNATEWTKFILAHTEAHLLQNARWGELKACFGWSPVRILSGSSGAQLLIRRLPLGIQMAYIPKGPIGKDFQSLFAEIDQYCTRNGIAFLKVEADEISGDKDLQEYGQFHPALQTIQPRRSILIGLQDDQEGILGRMKQKTRYNIGLSAKKGVRIEPWTDVQGFHTLMQTTGERDAFGVHSLAYYLKAYELFHPGGDCEILVARHEGEPLAALMIFKSGKRAWYFFGASSNQKRSLMPTYLLQWQAVLWAKERGCTSYDLWGVPDFDEDYLEDHFETRRDGLWGVYRFKRGFGGDLIRTPQSLDRIYRRSQYMIYRVGLRILRRSDVG